MYSPKTNSVFSKYNPTIVDQIAYHKTMIGRLESELVKKTKSQNLSLSKKAAEKSANRQKKFSNRSRLESFDLKKFFKSILKNVEKRSHFDNITVSSSNIPVPKNIVNSPRYQQRHSNFYRNLVKHCWES